MAFCYARAHLHGIGLTIAATCDLTTLVQKFGAAVGQVLFDQSRERPLAAIAHDVAEGFVTPEAAQRDYGVVIGEDGTLDAEQLDAKESARRRQLGTAAE